MGYQRRLHGALVQLLQCSRSSTVPPPPASTTRLPSSTPRPAPCTSRALTPTTRPTTPPPTTTFQRYNLEQLSTNPSVEEIQRCLWLIHGNHVTSTEDPKEGEVAAVLDLAVLVTTVKLDVLDIGLVEVLLSWPLKCLGPGLVTEPVADEISITSVDQDWDLLKNAWYETVEWLHPVTLEKEVSVDIEVAAVIAADLNAKLLLNIGLVQELADPAES